MRAFSIDSEIARASTLPSWVYSDPEVFAAQRERVFARSWQLVGDTDRVRVPGQVSPTLFLHAVSRCSSIFHNLVLWCF